jgi:hypothetical protein
MSHHATVNCPTSDQRTAPTVAERAVDGGSAKSDWIYRSTGKREYGLTDRELDALPHRTVPNPYRRSGPPGRLYRRSDVERLANSLEIQARLAKKASQNSASARRARRRAREARLRRRYPAWRDALVPACQAMFSLNRHAKHNKCRSSEEIYQLKNELITLLYEHGYCIECRVHVAHLPEQQCRACKGTGEWNDSDWDTDEVTCVGVCDRCGGSGIYRSAKTLRFVAFRFEVDGQTYAWHQPDYLVTFSYQVTAAPEAGGLADEKPVEMTAKKMSEGKSIIRFVLVEASRDCVRDRQTKTDVVGSTATRGALVSSKFLEHEEIVSQRSNEIDASHAVESQTGHLPSPDASAQQPNDRVSRTAAKREFGLRDGELDALPHLAVPNPRGRRGRPARFYLLADVERLANSPTVRARRENAAARKARRLELEEARRRM